MDLSASFANDWRTWDNTEPLRVERAGRPVSLAAAPGAANRRDYVVAKRRAVRTKEKSPSGGVYLGSEANFLVPVALLVPGWVFAPADVLVIQPPQPDAGQRFTALTAQLGKGRQTWLLGTANLALAANLSDTVNVERPAISNDAAGAYVKAFPSDASNPGGTLAYQNLPARVQLVEEDLADERGLRGFQGRVNVIVDRQIAVNDQDRLAWVDALGQLGLPGATVYLDIERYRDPQRIDELPVIECRRKV